MSKYHSDQPINKNNNDEFNRGSFVGDFIKILSNLEDDENYIIGLFAKWGLGKTSTVNLILDKLESDKEFCAVYVSAWALGGDYEKILWDILDQVYRKIENKNVKTGRVKFGRLLSKVAEAEYPIEIDGEFDFNENGKNETNITSGKITKTMGYIGKMLISSDTITKARKRIENDIKGKKVVVFIDDLDRLGGKQIMEILRSINTVADYGGMTYVLPFDKRYVCSAVEECLPKGRSGDEFIEKVIQVPINLPALTQSKIDKVMTSKLSVLFSEYHVSVSQEEITRFQQLYYNGVNKYLSSPRDINKLINVLRFKIPITYGEINIIDTIILEIIRVFDEPLYELIKENRALLVKQDHSFSQDYFMDKDNKKRKGDAEKIFSGLEESQLQIIQKLFPAIDVLYSNMIWEDVESLRRLQRIASENYFDLFFASLDEEEGISDKKILQLLKFSGEPQKLRNILFRLVNQNNFDIALRTMTDKIDIVEDRLELCKALLDLVESFPAKYYQYGFRLSSFDILIIRIDEILKASSKKLTDYISLLDYNYENNRFDTIPFLIREVVHYSKSGKNRREIELTEEEVTVYKEHALEIIRKVAEKNKIPIDTIGDDALIYHYWTEFGDTAECSFYIKKRVKMASQVVDFISQFLNKNNEFGKNDLHRTDLDEATYMKISTYIEPDYFYDFLVRDKIYKNLQNSKYDDLVSFENQNEANGKLSDLSKVGNEHTDKFRLVVAQRFMYFYENMASDNKEINDK